MAEDQDILDEHEAIAKKQIPIFLSDKMRNIFVKFRKASMAKLENVWKEKCWIQFLFNKDDDEDAEALGASVTVSLNHYQVKLLKSDYKLSTVLWKFSTETNCPDAMRIK